MTIATNLDVRGVTVTKYEYLPLEVTYEIARDEAKQVRVFGQGENSGFLSVFVQILTQTGKPKVGITQLQNHWQRERPVFII
jgi:hypothetical protein